MANKDVLKEKEGRNSKNFLEILTFILASLSIMLTLQKNYTDLNTQRNNITIEDQYNKKILKTFNEIIDNEVDTTILNRFSTQIYKQNWEILGSLKETCPTDRLELVTTLDSINFISDSMLTLYNQEGLIYNTIQWNNTKDRQFQWKKSLKENVIKANVIFEKISRCNFPSNYSY